MGKLNKNQQGFTGIEGMLALTVIVLIGVVGFMVYNNHKKAVTPVTASTTSPSTLVKATTPKAKASDLPQGFTQYNNAEKGISLGYPSDWKVDPTIPDPNKGPAFVAFISADYKYGETAIGADGVLQGASLSVETAKPIGFDVQQDYKQPKFAADITNFKLGGEKAVRYFVSYEGPATSTAVVYKNGIQYTIRLGYPQSDDVNGVRKQYEPIFLQALETVKFN